MLFPKLNTPPETIPLQKLNAAYETNCLLLTLNAPPKNEFPQEPSVMDRSSLN